MTEIKGGALHFVTIFNPAENVVARKIYTFRPFADMLLMVVWFPVCNQSTSIIIRSFLFSPFHLKLCIVFDSKYVNHTQKSREIIRKS